ncbi:MAG TPA: sigma 54-interacting transcriptional regulator [Myxococcota bacterium]|nr:sigma 54-interacting transcriptional regulator [Myxococcota bacterium]
MAQHDEAHREGRAPEPVASSGDPGRAEDRLLRTLVEAVESETGDPFFRSLVKHLAEALGVRYAFVSELTRGGTHFRTHAVWEGDRLGANFEVPLFGTPCEAVLCGQIGHHPHGLQQLFPDDHGLVRWGAVSYGGVPMFDSAGRVVGHFAIMHDRPLVEGDRALHVMRIFAARAVAEIERKRAEAALRASEERLGQILASAADGILVTDDEGTILYFNPAAERILRCPASEAIGGSAARFGTEEGVAARRLADEQLRAHPDRLFFFGRDRGIHARRADGTLFLHEGSIARHVAQDRALTTVIFRDVEERRDAERELSALRDQNAYLREELESVYPFEEIVGRSPLVRKLLADVDRVAATDASVLIQGETGTGKELVARAVHAHSARRDRALVKVNCAALAPGLVESELFGHEKGAFTGASERRIGRFELASGGTIFLDEVGDIPLETQVKLLRVLQEREIERAGGSQTIRVDVRVIAATNRDLPKAIADGRFRQDLYYRLNVFPLVVPPLRERPGDVALLARYFVERHASKLGRRATRVSDATLARLERYAWPGNVRELENVIERALILSSGAELEIGADVLGDAPRVPAARADGGSLEEVERRHVIEILRATGWRIDGPSGAAARLGLNPSTLRSRIKKLGISRSRDAIS